MSSSSVPAPIPVSENQPIQCDYHDYVEIACMFGYEVRVATTDGQLLSGLALDTQSDGNSEFLVLKAPDRRFLIRLSAVTSFEALTEGARFGKLRFR